ncbi:RNA polymerase sigma factor [Dyadobacter pollutisoli]|uniref:Sigma-70 family RNA polymerase sigma factor n=1 Tax=Dyadobacter pollutisoli TaxID=2910158 RepID=A0A9E8NIS5_9BACT|nr:sigma factor [Dyadobacter pollutisoli]WAC15042.1 hypothetical protein ON006_13960 [Dyadobacter pollutisoli]
MKKYSDISNSEHLYDELWTRFLAGDEAAFEEIYQVHVDNLYSYGVHIVANTWLVQEAIQDLFADLWRSRNTLSDTTSIKYYLFRALRRRLHRMIRSEQTFTEISVDDKSHKTPQTNSFETDLIAQENQFEQIRRLRDSMAKLPPRRDANTNLVQYGAGTGTDEAAPTDMETSRYLLGTATYGWLENYDRSDVSEGWAVKLTAA